MRLPLTPILRQLPEMVPFVGPETLERSHGRAIRVRLGANESIFGISPAARRAMTTAVDDVWMYNDPEAYDLTMALSQHHDVVPASIQVGAGIDELLGLLVRAFAAPGEPVVMPLGSYPTFAYHVIGHGARLETVPYRDDHVDLPALAAKVKDQRAHIVYLANPDNPMGTWCSGSEIEQFSTDVGDQCVVILDEAYADFAPVEAIPRLRGPGNVIRTRTFSKAHGMAGARVGYLLADPGVVSVLAKVRNHFGVNRMAQAGALASLGDAAFVSQVVAEVEAGKAHLQQLLEPLGLLVLPSATNFMNVDLGSGERARAVLAGLLDRDVFVRMPSQPPGDRCIRVTIGRAADLAAFVDALADTLQSLEPDGTGTGDPPDRLSPDPGRRN